MMKIQLIATATATASAIMLYCSVKVERELKLNHTEMSMIRWMCGVKLNERKKSEELRKLLGLEPVSVMIKKSRLRWFGHVE